MGISDFKSVKTYNDKNDNIALTIENDASNLNLSCNKNINVNFEASN